VLRREGLKVPSDIAVAGFDDIPLAQYVAPSLTTVHQPFYRLGETAAELLIARIRGEAPSDGDAHHVIRTRLVIRESCGGRALPV
jgi:LacI family transcriptional regulator